MKCPKDKCNGQIQSNEFDIDTTDFDCTISIYCNECDSFFEVTLQPEVFEFTETGADMEDSHNRFYINSKERII